MSQVPPTAAPSRRLAAIDVLRGAVMLLMAIDHVRVYSGVPAGGPDPAVFFTRWITHFCAPGFAFLAGASAFLHGRKLGDAAALARFLVTRGLFLVALELTFLHLAWTFNPTHSLSLLAGVIWMLGWCLVLLAALVRLPTPAVAAFGLALIFGHDLVDPYLGTVVPALDHHAGAWLLRILYFGGVVPIGPGGSHPLQLAVLYSIVPWIGVMAAGYAFGALLELEPARRDRLCLRIGLGAIALFLVLRGFNLYGNPSPWGAPGSRLSPLLSFLATSKYPASLLFLLMTLGPTIALVPLADRARGAAARVLATFGRVPLFYYLLHIPLIHAAAIAVSWARNGSVDPWLFANHPMMVPPAPPGYTWSLPLLYAVWAGVVAALYVPCRWFEGVRRTRRSRWLSYL